MPSNMRSRRRRTEPTSGLPRAAKGKRCALKLPTTETATEPKSQQALRPESDWRTFATGCRRPMAEHIVSRPDRTTGGALALSSKFPLKPEKNPDAHPDHPGRR